MSVPINPMGAGAVAVGAVGPARPRPTAAATGAGGITPGDIWRIIRARLWAIIITAFILIIVGVSINLAWYVLWPSWPGVALLRVESPIIEEVMTERQVHPANVLEMTARSEANAITSREYAHRVLQHEKIIRTNWLKKFRGNMPKALKQYEKRLRASSIRDTSLVRISFYTKHMDEAPLIVNTLVSIFLADRQLQASGDLTDTLTGLRSRQRTLTSELGSLSDSIRDYVEEEKISVTALQKTEVETTLGKLAETHTDLSLAIESTKGALDDMKKQSLASWIPDANSQMRMDRDPTIQTLKQYLLQLEQERETRSKRLGYEHLHIKLLDERIHVTGRDLQSEQAELRQQIFLENLNGLETQVTRYETSLVEIGAQIAAIRDEQNLSNPKILVYRSMEVNREKREIALGELDKRIADLEATILRTKTSGTQVTRGSLAVTAPVRSSPNLLINLIATGVLSIMGGVGMAFLLEFMDKSLRSSQDIRRHTSLALLGMIPALEEDEANPRDMYSVVTHAPRSLLAEAFRRIRTNIVFSCSRDKCGSILITSPAPDDGRTCIAVNLAASIALSGKKVLLIDANFHKPALDRLFPDVPDVGFGDLLSGKASVEETIVESDTPGLWVMGNGQTTSHSHHSRLLASSKLGAVIEKVSGQFDQVILDGPPALLSADALTICGQASGVVFVARAGKSLRGELNRMRDDIGRLNNRILGVVLNAVEAVGGGYLRERYRLFYDYQGASVELDTEAVAVASGQEGSKADASEKGQSE